MTMKSGRSGCCNHTKKAKKEQASATACTDKQEVRLALSATSWQFNIIKNNSSKWTGLEHKGHIRKVVCISHLLAQ